MILSAGEKILVVSRPLFNGDLRRNFVGEVQEVLGPLARVSGYAFVYDANVNDFVKREDERVRIFSLVDATLMIVILPDETDVPSVRHEIRAGERYITDGKGMMMKTSALNARR